MKAVTQEKIDIPEKPRGIHRSFGIPVNLMDTILGLRAGESFIVDDARSRDYALIIGARKNVPITTRKEKTRFRIWRTK